jgi:hypothetical protein
VPGALDVRSGGHPHVWILTLFDSFSKAESTGQVVRRHGLELLTEPGDPGGRLDDLTPRLREPAEDG